MPELPEVETVRRQLQKNLRGQRIADVQVDPEDRFLFAYVRPEAFRRALKGAKVTGSGRKGKYFWLELDRKPWPVFHLGMTGNVEIRPAGSKKPHLKAWGGVKLWSEGDRKSDPHILWFCRLLFTSRKGTEVALTDPRRFGRVWLADDPETMPRIARLGFDPLGDFPSARELALKLAKRNKPIKAVLLDQALFAGIGNWLADEILFQAALSPHRKASSLSAPEVARLRTKTLAIVKKAVAVGADYERFPKTWLFHVRWGKAKDAKTSRGLKIIHEEVGGRTTAWVPSLQK